MWTVRVTKRIAVEEMGKDSQWGETREPSSIRKVDFLSASHWRCWAPSIWHPMSSPCWDIIALSACRPLSVCDTTFSLPGLGSCLSCGIPHSKHSTWPWGDTPLLGNGDLCPARVREKEDGVQKEETGLETWATGKCAPYQPERLIEQQNETWSDQKEAFSRIILRAHVGSCSWGLVKARQMKEKMVQSARILLGQGSDGEGSVDWKHQELAYSGNWAPKDRVFPELNWAVVATGVN